MKPIDQDLVRDLYLSLDSESEFYKMFLFAYYVCTEKKYRKGQFDSAKFINGLQNRIAIFCDRSPQYFSYNRKMFGLVSKQDRVEVAKLFESYFLGELSIGNSWLPVPLSKLEKAMK